MSKASSIHAVGSRQSFNDIPDSDELISLETLRADEALPEAVTVDREATSCQISPRGGSAVPSSQRVGGAEAKPSDAAQGPGSIGWQLDKIPAAATIAAAPGRAIGLDRFPSPPGLRA